MESEFRNVNHETMWYQPIQAADIIFQSTKFFEDPSISLEVHRTINLIKPLALLKKKKKKKKDIPTWIIISGYDLKFFHLFNH
jgi:hypothetical protein